MTETVLVTGGHGFVAGALVVRLSTEGFDVRCTVRRGALEVPTGVRVLCTGSIDGTTRWQEALEGVSLVVHCAARVHRLDDGGADESAEYRRSNCDGTIALAQQAAAAGVRRFVFLSSIKVNGEATFPGRPFRADDPPAPCDPYATSKWEAETLLRTLAALTGLEVVVIRPPLVYGPGVKANFRNMMKTLSRGLPLPFGLIRNRRSLVSLANLVDLIVIALSHSAAAGQTFLVSDGENLSTTELLQRTARALGRRSRLIPVPERLLGGALVLIGRSDLRRRLLESLEVDIEATRNTLGWNPPVGVDQALVDTAQHFLATDRRNARATG